MDVMGVHVGPSQPLMEAGLDSLAAVELRSAISARFGIAVPATVALDHPTVQVYHPHHLLQADNTERTYPWIIPLSCKISQSSQHLRKGSIAVVLVSNTRRGGFTESFCAGLGSLCGRALAYSGSAQQA